MELIKYTESEIYTKILERKKNLNEKVMIGMLIAFPNKQEKLELIVQKLTEIGISHIYFRKAENSQIKELNENKIKRMRKIMKEALEQSR
ncbi:RsmE family RNA methyltransferase [bacterium]|nr:RsmE family RNA methyltransferase [bacterium]